jgi:hypothetical protein
LLKISEGNHDLDGLVELSILHKEMDTLLQDFWIVTFLNTGRYIFDQISKLVLKGKVQGLLSVASSTI